MPGVNRHGNRGSKKASGEVITQFFNLVKAGVPIGTAAEQVGYTKSWGYNMVAKIGKPGMSPIETSSSDPDSDLPEPKAKQDLDGGVKDTLRDFLLFRQVFLCRDETPWARDAANKTVDWLLDKTEKSFAVENMAPGSGKSTIFTHDLVLWLLCGGGAEDPAFGRALRFMLGSATKNVSIHYVTRLRSILQQRRPYYDKNKQQHAELVLAKEFGRFRPKPTLGEESLWKADQFTVAQIGELELYEKEPTVQAASRESGFLGERCNLAIWDDLVTDRNSRTVEQAEALAEWFEKEGESRVEPGGVLLLVGQRLGPLDLYRNRLDATFTNELGEEEAIYKHIVYPAHFDHLCKEAAVSPACTQWDGEEQGCLLDSHRLSWRDLLKAQSKPYYRTVFQQEDQDPESTLVHKAWIEGGTDHTGYEGPGCYDRHRGFMEWPNEYLFDYVCVDPSVSGWWVAEWWALNPDSGRNYLIYGERRKMQSGGSDGFLDFDPTKQEFVGLVEDLQSRSGDLGHPIRLWIVEQNAAHKYLLQDFAYKMWRRKWPNVEVIPHSTQKNKNDKDFGVFATLPMAYKTGMKRLPRRKGDMKALNYLRIKEHELTTYPMTKTDDTVMADWFGEMNREFITKRAKRSKVIAPPDDSHLPPYLRGRG